MKPIHQHFIAVALLLLCAFQGSAQSPIDFTFTTATPNPAVGATFAVQVKVNNFKNIVSMQFPITFNGNVLQLNSITGVNSNLNAAPNAFTATLGDPNANVNLINPGKLAVSWVAQVANGVNIANNGILFVLNFTVLANGTTTVNLMANMQPTIELYASTNLSVPAVVTYQNGVTITAGTGGAGPVIPVIQGPHIIANTIYIPQGEIGCMPVTVNDFVDIETFTYAMNWNPTVLELVSTRNSRSNKLLPDEVLFGVFNSTGRVSTTWYTPSMLNTRADLSSIYEVCYKAKGAAGTNTLVTPNGDGFGPTGSPELIQRINATTTKNLWSLSPAPDTTGIADTIFIQNTPPPTSAVTFIGEQENTLQNTVGCVDIKVKNFTNVRYGEFALTYDSLQLKFDHFELGTNPLGLDTSSASPTNIENFLKFNAVDIVNSVSGNEQTLRFIQFAYRDTLSRTLADNTTAFSACFRAIGAPNATVPVTISSYRNSDGNVTVPIGAAKKTVGGVPINYTAGSVHITSANAPAAVATVQNATCGSNGSITLAVTNCSGTATYAWTGPGGFTAATKDISGLAAGTYQVTVTCSAGGNSTASATVTGAPPIMMPAATVTGVACFGGSTGTITINPSGGNAPYTYQWTGPSGFTSTMKNPTGLKAGNNYKVTITDASSCSFTSGNISVSQSPPIEFGPTAGVSMLNVKCNGGTDGSITIPEAMGGTSPYTYAWTGPGTYVGSSKSITGLRAGTYTVTITDAQQCTFVAPALMITQPPALSFDSANSHDITCKGDNNGSIMINVTGGTTPYTYAWRNPAGTIVSTQPTATNLLADVYNLIVTDANQCTAISAPQTIHAPSAPLTVTATPENASCATSTDGAIHLTISGGWNNPTVQWSSPSLPSTPDASGILNATGVLPGIYTATITDAQGCSITTSVTVGANSGSTLAITSDVNHVACHGEATGGIVLNITGGGTGATYDVQWNGGLSGPAIGSLPGGDYVPTVTLQGTACSTVFPAIHVDEPVAIAITSTPTTPTSGNNGAIDIDTITGGAPNYTVNWTGPNGYTGSGLNITGLAPGDYVVHITDSNGCNFTSTISLTGSGVPLATVTSIKDACGSADGCIYIQIAPTATAPFVLSWSGQTKVVTEFTTSVCNLAPGFYTITVTDANGGSTVLSNQQIEQGDPAQVGDNRMNPTNGLANGSIQLMPIPLNAPLTYLWNTSATTSALINIDTGTYTVTVTNTASGCTATYTYQLSYDCPPISASVNTPLTRPTCLGTSGGAITLQVPVAANYSYVWSGPNGFTKTTKDISGLFAGNYSVTITNPCSGSTQVNSIVLDEQSHLTVTNVTETSLYGAYQISSATACDGKATVAFSGQAGTAIIAWSNGVTTVNNTTLCGGAYGVTVTDQLGCTSSWSDELTSPAAVHLAFQPILPVSCHGECDGIAQISVVGGTAPYIVRWALPSNQFQVDQLTALSPYSIAANLCSGTYKITVTDSNGASMVDTVSIADPASITAAFNQTLPSRFNSCDAELMVSVTGATGVPTYAWSGSNGHSGEGARADGLCAGEAVIFTIVDDKGCVAMAQDTINYPKDGCLQGSPVITPGEQDGKNDELFITCAETVNNTVEIFNRWGQMVFNAQNYDNNGIVWTGASKSGAALPEGVYFYVMTYTDDQGQEQRIKGYVNLVR